MAFHPGRFTSSPLHLPKEKAGRRKTHRLSWFALV